MNIRNFKQLFSAVCALVLGAIGYTIGQSVPRLKTSNWILDQIASQAKDLSYYRFLVGAIAVIGVLLGVIFGPKLAQAIVNAGNSMEQMPTKDKIALFIGTVLGILTSLPFFILLMRVDYVGVPLAILLTFAFVYLGIRASMSIKTELRFLSSSAPPVGPDGEELSMEKSKILDTNIIIDGRIIDVCKSGFLDGPIYIPGFVLDELQHIADSSDSLKRTRGRRGLDILNAMQKEFPLIIRSYDYKIGNENPKEEVDAKLVRLAKKLGGSIVTNDYNLNKVAALQGVTVLNVNELANALKPVVLPGEEMPVTIIKEGKESNQGVAYLDDGTMIVVEDGRRFIGEHRQVVVTSVLQTVAGKMIFARSKGSEQNDGDDLSGQNIAPGPSGFGSSSGRSRFKVR